MMRSPRWRQYFTLVAEALPSARGLLPLVALLGVWQLLPIGNSPYFPPPSEWWDGLMLLAKSGRLYPALSATTITLLLGLAVAVFIGTGIGLLIGVFPRFSRAFGPFLEFLRAIPPPAVVPMAILFMGYDERMKLTVVVLAAIWPILLNTSSAAERVHPLLLDVARSFRLSPFDRIRLIILPSVVPATLLGIRVALPVAIVVTLLVEILTSIDGIGALMIGAQRNFQSSQVYGLLVVIGLFGLLLNNAFAVLEAFLLRRWPPKTQARISRS
jgi:ABC-type nitrate/sulfonate/bicarbonate transport system permease component